MAFRYPQPDNEDDFEELCLRLYRKLWKNESLKLYAKRGERQDGVDIFDPLSIAPVRAVQCKHHESTKPLPQSEIETEVAKAEHFQFPIQHYIIATTAKKGRKAQDTVAALNLRRDKKFTVDIHFWEDICQQASELGRVMAELIIYGENILAGAVPDEQRRTVWSSDSSSPIESLDSQEPYRTIEDLLNDRRLELVRHELDKLPNTKAAESLPLNDRYKLLRLRAKLELEEGNFDTAGDLFLKAYSVAPELDQAKQNQVLALSLLGDTTQAYARATEYIAAGLKTPVMVLRLLDSITSQDQLTQHASLFEPLLHTDENINTVLSYKYMRFGDYADAYEAAARALTIATDSPHAHLAAALAMHNAAVYGERDQRLNRLRVALTHYNSALPAARQQRFKGLLPEILVNRAAAKMLLGDTHGAAHDYRAAVDSATRTSVYAERAIGFFLQEQDFASARELLDAMDRGSREARYLALVSNYEKANLPEKRKSIDEMALLAEQKWDRARECRFHCVQWALDLGETELAESFVSTAFREEHPFQAHTMLAWIRMSSQDEARAKEEALKALDQSIQSAHPQELRVLANLLVRLGNDAHALGLLEQVSRPGVLDDEMKNLITCAQRLNRHDLLLRICRELRASGAQDEQLRRLELQLLNQYAPDDAFQLTDEFIQKSDRPSYFVAFRNLLAVRLRRLEELTLDPAVLPSPAELSPAEVPIILVPYVVGARYNEALEFLYAQRRCYYEDERAHGQYIFFFLQHAHRTERRDPPPTVSADSAVLLEVSRGEPRWVIIENERPAVSRGEFAANSELGQRLVGRTVGDVIELPGNLLQVDSATIREIQTKYVRAFQDSLENFRALFPGTSALQQIDVGDDEHFDPSPIIDNLKERRAHVEASVQLYRDSPCPLYAFAQRVGLTELEALKALAVHPNGLVKCCQVTPSGFHEAAERGIASDRVVLSMSAIITLSLAHAWNHLDTTKKYLVSQLTSELIEEWSQDAIANRSEEGGVVALDAAGQLVFHEASNEERQARIEELRRIREMVDSHCARRSSLALAALDPEKRKQYGRLLGVHNLESISVAKDERAVLWTDDVVVGLVGSADFGVSSVWTQLALRCGVVSGSVPRDEFNRVTAKLAGWDYASIVWTPETIIAAGAQSEWNVGAWPLSKCLGLIRTSEASISTRVKMIVEFLQLLRRSDCSELKQGAVIQTALDALGDARAVRWILRRLDHIFGVDIPSAEFVRIELEYWLRLR